MSNQVDKPLRILRAPAVYAKTGLNKSHIQKLIARGAFPRPIKLGVGPRAHAAGYIESEIDAWITERIAASRGEPKAA
jgi:prophage regulatory protein